MTSNVLTVTDEIHKREYFQSCQLMFCGLNNGLIDYQCKIHNLIVFFGVHLVMLVFVTHAHSAIKYDMLVNYT